MTAENIAHSNYMPEKIKALIWFSYTHIMHTNPCKISLTTNSNLTHKLHA